MRLWKRRVVQVGRDPRRSPARPPAHSWLSCEMGWLLMMLPGSRMGLGFQEGRQRQKSFKELFVCAGVAQSGRRVCVDPRSN